MIHGERRIACCVYSRGMKYGLIWVALVLGCGSKQPTVFDASPDGASDATDAPIDAPTDGGVPAITGMCSTAGWCWQNPRPHGNSIRAVHAVNGNPDDVWVVGGGIDIEIAMHWDGTAWTRVGLPPREPGAEWGSMTDIWASGANDVWVVGVPGRILRWTGTHWNRETLPVEVATLGAVWGTSANDVWAVGYSTEGSGIALHYTNGSWVSVPTEVSEPLSAVHGIAANDVWITAKGTTLHWNGATFDRPPSAIGSYLDGVWAASSNDVWSVGFDGLQRWDGETWNAAGSTGGYAIA
ncbi:MAG TPA: hypothetical protein VIU61_24500, partial [Kofleriaceae bacterium]